jgi:hypothetical protein
MKTEALFLFLIILLGLVLCSFLGGNCGIEGMKNNDKNILQKRENNNTSKNSYDNYNHYTGQTSELTSGMTFYDDKGNTVVVSSNGTLQITLPGSNTPVTFSAEQPSTTLENFATKTTYYGPNGATAIVIDTSAGRQGIKVVTNNGTYYYNTQNGSLTSTQYYGSTGYQGAYGGEVGSVSGPYGNTAYYAQGPGGTTAVATSKSNTNDDYSSSKYYGQYGGEVGAVTGPQGNTAYYAQGPGGATVSGSYSDDYMNSLPPGIPRSQIPQGQEDLYILKSQVVPPVCPACPPATTYPRQEQCPPCPACARCPEPSFECKKVPNYNAIGSEYLPAPVLNDFSTFGM